MDTSIHDRTMYWAGNNPGRIVRAHMDGSNVTNLIARELLQPIGIVVDCISSGIFWADCDTHKVQTSDLEGNNISVIGFNEVGMDCPWGIATHDGTVYWTNWSSKKILGSQESGGVFTVYNGRSSMQHMALAMSTAHLPKNRENDCHGRNCSSLCVLTPSSFRCVDSKAFIFNCPWKHNAMHATRPTG